MVAEPLSTAIAAVLYVASAVAFTVAGAMLEWMDFKHGRLRTRLLAPPLVIVPGSVGYLLGVSAGGFVGIDTAGIAVIPPACAGVLIARLVIATRGGGRTGRKLLGR